MKKILIIFSIIISILVLNKDNSVIIPSSSIRFRAIANSNSLVDQNIKNKTSLYLSKYLEELTRNSKTSEEALEILHNNHDNINNYIDDYFKKNNINSKYEVLIGRNYFPKKSYKGVDYKAGYYDSVLLNIGSHKGVNWWCIVYPPLCTIKEENKSDIEYTFLIKDILNKYNLKD